MKYAILLNVIVGGIFVQAQETKPLKIEISASSLAEVAAKPGLLEFATEYATLVTKRDTEKMAKYTARNGADQAWRETEFIFGTARVKWDKILIKINIESQPVTKINWNKKEALLNLPAIAVMEMYFDLPDQESKGKFKFYISKIDDKLIMSLPRS